MKDVDQLIVRLKFDRDVRPTTEYLRAAIASLFPANPLFHQHTENKLIYRMPQIQYRWDEHGPLIVGLLAGAEQLLTVEWPGLELRLGNDRVRVTDAEVSFLRCQVKIAPHLMRYEFVAPWLPFSQQNYERYQLLANTEQPSERDRLARAGILISLRGMGVEITERIYVAVEYATPVKCNYKGVSLLGFSGIVLVNLVLPSGFAFGKAISHGYGWILPTVETPIVGQRPKKPPTNLEKEE